MSIFSLAIRPPPSATLFPYTTLFRSELEAHGVPRRRGQSPRPGEAVADRRGAGPAGPVALPQGRPHPGAGDRKSTRLNSSHVEISYAVFCLKKKTLHASRTSIK